MYFPTMGRSFPARNWGFVHSSSSPRYPQSNGLAEKAVQTAKIIILKATASGRDPYIALLEYCTTPISDCRKSPAQLLMSRRLRSILHSTAASLQPDVVNPETTQRRFEEKQETQNMFYDKTRAGISVGDQILPRKNTGGYQSAVVTEKADTAVVQCSYEGRCNLHTHQSTSQETEARLHLKHCGVRS